MIPSKSPKSPPARTIPRRLPSPIYRLIVECKDERDQKALYERMIAERRKCRVLTLS